MLDIEELKGHRSSSVDGIHVAAGRTKPGMTAERNIFEISAGRAGIHGATKRRIATINHFFYIFDDGVTRMLNINMGRIDPVEYVGVSQQRNGNVRNIIHPLCGCATLVIQKITFPL